PLDDLDRHCRLRGGGVLGSYRMRDNEDRYEDGDDGAAALEMGHAKPPCGGGLAGTLETGRQPVAARVDSGSNANNQDERSVKKKMHFERCFLQMDGSISAR